MAEQSGTELSAYIRSKEIWLQAVLDKLGWTVEGLQKGDQLTLCSVNAHHFVPEGNLAQHLCRCGRDEEEDEFETKATIRITPALQAAVLAHVKTEQENAMNLQQEMVTMPASLVDDSSPSNDVFSHGPLHTIGYIKSWKLVPKMFAVISPNFLKMADIRAWLYKNLPPNHSQSRVVGGEVNVVEMVARCLTQPDSSGNVNPDYVIQSTHQLFGPNTTSFILELWKFLAISSLQEQHNIPNSVVNDIVPLRLPATGSQPSQRFPMHLLEAAQYAVGTQGEGLNQAGLLSAPLSVDDRKALYDFVVEAAGVRNPDRKLDDLYRDDFYTKLQKDSQQKPGDLEPSTLEEMARQRDYKRRRQTYRAKNVHITKRSTVEVMRDVINARMAELVAELKEEATPLDNNTELANSSSHDQDLASPDHDSRHSSRDYHQSRHHEHDRQLQRRSRSHSRDKEHHHRSRSHSRGRQSRSHSRDKRHHHRSRSHSHEKKHKHSRSHSRDKRHRHKHKHKHKHVQD
ncbi:uncharacterized protein [Dysidea avara]|uniref:uncharacterized protein n=1 Tax=Dysidea avara TaxID=196820 RepID=UPI00331E5B8C